MSKNVVNPKQHTINAAYSDLYKFYNNGDYDKAVKAVNRILAVAPDDQTALHSKVVCLIQSSKFEEAYKFIEKNRLGSALIFEKAYCEYRLNKVEQALKTIDDEDIVELPVNLKELRTQVLYRLERYDECFEHYKEIIKNVSDDYDEERLTNFSAVVAHLATDESKELAAIPENTYEQYFNSACVQLHRQNYVEAERKLRACEKVCRDMLEEDGASEEEIREELDVIRVQTAYCLQMQGKIKEAAIIYADCLRNKPKDPALVAVASNNTVSINREQNVFDSKKKIRAALSEACDSKLTSKQKRAIALNNCLLSLYSSGSEQVTQLTQKLEECYPELEFEVLLIRCVQLVKEKKHKQAIELLRQYGKTHKQEELSTTFAEVQLLLAQGERKEAISVLNSLPDQQKYQAGIVSALVTLYLGTNNKETAAQVLKNAVEWYKKNKVNSNDLTDMWRQAADFHLRSGEYETAARSLEELLKINKDDTSVLSQLVIAYAHFDPKGALETSKKLPELETLTTPEEIDALETANWIMSAKSKKPAAGPGQKTDSAPSTPLVEPKKSHRKRKGKLPKNYNASVAPDPERWLPKYERTGFRKKRDKRSKDIIKGSQGMSSVAAEQYDMSNRANQSKNSPVTPAYQESTPGPRQQHRKGGHKGKKKGGRK